MAELEVTLMAIIGSIIIAIIGYFANGWRERSFERRKTNYHMKLRAFREINDSSLDLINVYQYLRKLSAKNWEETEFDQALQEILLLSVLAREVEAPVGTKVADKRAKDFEKIGSIFGSRRREKAAEGWIEGQIPSLFYLYIRVLAFHLNRLGKASADALLVAETPAVQIKIGKIVNHIQEQYDAIESVTSKEIEESDVDRKIRLIKIKEFDTVIGQLIINLQFAMRFELNLTMLSCFGQKWLGYKLKNNANNDDQRNQGVETPVEVRNPEEQNNRNT